MLAGVGGVLTLAVLVLALVGRRSRSPASPARTLLVVAALAGFVTALPFWIPAAVLLGAAALILGQAIRHGAPPASLA
jgi:uncharacterized membrane protein